MARLVLGLVLACGAISAHAQPASEASPVRDLIYGPAPQRVADLDATWYEAVISVRSAARGVEGLAATMAPGQRAGDRGVYYTRGATTVIGGRPCLVAYTPVPGSADWAALFGRSGESAQPTSEQILDALAPRLTPETPLALAPIAVESIMGIEASRPFSLAPGRVVRPSLLHPIASQTAITAAILFPVFAQAREKARQTSSVSNLKQIALGAMMYCQDYDERFPPMKDQPSVAKLLDPYLRNRELWVQPGTNQPYVPNRAASRKPLAAIEFPAQFVLFYEARPGRDGLRAVAFADGHVKRVTPQEWLMLKRKSGVP